MIRHPYSKVLIEREAFNRGETVIEGVMKRLGMKEGPAQDAILGLTYSKPPKARTKGTNVQGEQCGRSNAKERDVKMILFYKGLFTELEMEMMVEGRIKRAAIGRILRGETWQKLQKGYDGVKKELTALCKEALTKKALREEIKVDKIRITLELRDISEDIAVIKKRIRHLKRTK